MGCLPRALTWLIISTEGRKAEPFSLGLQRRGARMAGLQYGGNPWLRHPPSTMFDLCTHTSRWRSQSDSPILLYRSLLYMVWFHLQKSLTSSSSYKIPAYSRLSKNDECGFSPWITVNCGNILHKEAIESYRKYMKAALNIVTFVSWVRLRLMACVHDVFSWLCSKENYISSKPFAAAWNCTYCYYGTALYVLIVRMNKWIDEWMKRLNEDIMCDIKYLTNLCVYLPHKATLFTSYGYKGQLICPIFSLFLLSISSAIP